MKWTLTAACVAIAATLWPPAEAAQPTSSTAAPAAATAAPPGESKSAAATAPVGTADAAANRADEPITFEQYREWRLNYIERRRSELAIQLAAADLPERQRTRLEQVKAYYDWFAALPDADRDRRFRERFDRIDANHDGIIDAGERVAWRDKQRPLYRHNATARPAAPEAAGR